MTRGDSDRYRDGRDEEQEATDGDEWYLFTAGDRRPAEFDELRWDELAPGSTYEKHGYTFRTDEYGRVAQAEGWLRDNTGVRSAQQTEVGRLGRETDDGGHLIASRFDGPTDGFNLVPQDANLNRGDWKRMENRWADTLERGGQVEVAIQVIGFDGNIRPDGFDVTYRMIEADGTEAYAIEEFYNERNGQIRRLEG